MDNIRNSNRKRGLQVLVSAFLMLASAGALQAQKIPTTSFGKGINFMAADSSMTMKMQFRMQNLFEVEYTGADKSTAVAAQLRRSRLKFGGYVFSPKLQYKAEIGLASGDISTSAEDGRTSGSSRMVLDAVLKYQFAKSWSVWVGQTKLPGNRERVVSSADLQFVDRSRVNSKFNLDRDMGFQLHGKVNLGAMIIKPKLAWTMGEGRSIADNNVGGFNYTGRLEFLPTGEFEGKNADYVLSDLDRQSKPKIAFGVTYNVNDRAARQQGQLGSYVKLYDTSKVFVGYQENTLQALQIDMIFKYKGISSLIEYANTKGQKGIKGYNTGSGFNAQVGYLFKSNYEIAGRFTTISPDDKVTSKLSGEKHYTLGVSKYIVGHKLKIQSDATLLQLDGVDDPNLLYRLQFEMQF
jgi:phosphate-selective porin OprO and OprP